MTSVPPYRARLTRKMKIWASTTSTRNSWMTCDLKMSRMPRRLSVKKSSSNANNASRLSQWTQPASIVEAHAWTIITQSQHRDVPPTLGNVGESRFVFALQNKKS